MNPIEDTHLKLILVLCTPVLLFIPVAVCLVLYLSDKSQDVSLSFEYPARWDSDYTEDYSDYDAVFNGEIIEDFYTLQFFESVYENANLRISYTPKSSSKTLSDSEIAQLTENEAWAYISNGIWSSYPTSSFADNKSLLTELQRDNTETISVSVWYWSNPSDTTDMSKTTVIRKFAVNSKLASTFIHIFEDIYNDPSQPVINIADKGMGTWVLRGKNHVSSNTMSAHALGCAIDINPSTGSFKINGKWYGNGYGHARMSYSTWQQLPECHTKYHVLYDGCPIVEIFKSYGFYWGGDWSSTTDCMHLAYIGDGSSARSKGIENYNSRQ